MTTEPTKSTCLHCKLYYSFDGGYQCFNRNSPYLRTFISVEAAKTKTCDAFEQRLTKWMPGVVQTREKSIDELEREVAWLTKRLELLQSRRKTSPRRG